MWGVIPSEMTMSPKLSLSGELLLWGTTCCKVWSFPRHQLNQHLFPIRFLKVIPIQSWGLSFNFSIWFLSLLGDDRPELVEEAIVWQKQHREKETIRLCLKHFRQHNYLEVFESLQKKTKIQLEHPLLTQVKKLKTVIFDKIFQSVLKYLITKKVSDWIPI